MFSVSCCTISGLGFLNKCSDARALDLAVFHRVKGLLLSTSFLVHILSYLQFQGFVSIFYICFSFFQIIMYDIRHLTGKNVYYSFYISHSLWPIFWAIFSFKNFPFGFTCFCFFQIIMYLHQAVSVWRNVYYCFYIWHSWWSLIRICIYSRFEGLISLACLFMSVKEISYL
jgi:hypothetical protein